MQIQLKIAGMHCTACSARIEKVLNSKEAVRVASVNFVGETANVDFDERKTSVEELISWIEKIGFEAKSVKEDIFAFKYENKKILLHIISLLVLCLPFLWNMLVMGFNKHELMFPSSGQFIFALIAQFFCLPFYKNAWAALKGGVANMDILISLGTSIIFLYSSWQFFTASTVKINEIMEIDNVYFEGSVMILTFISLGKHIEQRLKTTTLNSLNELISLTAQKVIKKVNKDWQEVEITSVEVGDILKTQHGEKIAADGILIDGNIWCDESHLSGESQALEKISGDKVLAGALVISGAGEYKAEKLGLQTQLGEMMKALSKAQGSKAAIARIADKVAGIFVPTIIALAVLVFLITYLIKDFNQAIVNSVSVLVIACPCAMGLATPAAIMAGMGRAVKKGIRFKTAEDLEKAGKISKVIFDKTGTLTIGKPQITNFYLNPKTKFSQEEIFSYSAVIEKNTTHPLALAVVEFCEKNSFKKDLEKIKLERVETKAGAGISAEIKGVGKIKIGKTSWTKAEIPAEIKNEILIGISINDEWVGIFALSDEIKKNAQAAIRDLEKLKISSLILTGDRKESAEKVAKFLNIDFRSEVSPVEKAQIVEDLKKQGEVVAMMGDGINDAAALCVADVGFSLASGSQTAENNSTVHLAESSPEQLVFAIKIAKATVKNIKQNLFLSLIYNCCAIPLAAFGFLSPSIAGLAMALSSLSVIFNAMRLKFMEIA